MPRWAMVFAAVAVVGGSGAYLATRSDTAQANAVIAPHRWQSIEPRELELIVTQRGELQAVENIELVSRVEGRTTITEIVREGASVKAGDVLVQLDSSAIRQQIEDATLELQRAETALLNAREMLEIQRSNNQAELEGAEVGKQLAQIELQKFLEGTFPQQKASAETKLEMAKINLQNKRDDLAQTRALFSRGFTTAADVKRQELAVTEAQNALAEANTALEVLIQYNYQADLASRQNTLAQATSRLERVKRQNESMLNQKLADVATAEQTLETRKRRVEFLTDQLAACTMIAPADGIVVYVNNRDQQVVIQQGAEIRERQAILRLPDTSSMKAIIRLNESQVARVRQGMRADISITGLPGTNIVGTIDKVSVVADSGNRWWNPDSREYPVEILLDTTPPNLKPGMGVDVKILSEKIEDALAVPVSALYSVGRRAFVFVPAGQGATPREVKLGLANGTHVQIVEGLEPGQRVLELEANEGKRLLESAGITISPEPNGRAERGGPPGDRGNAAGAPTTTPPATAPAR